MAGCQSCNAGCESKDSCTSCNSCEKCNRGCEKCNTCQGVCQKSQAFCSIGSQYVGNFSFNQSLSQDSSFLTKANWNRLITYINRAYAKGDTRDGGDSGLPASDTNTFMTADMFNKVSAALGGLGSNGPSRRVIADESIIYGSYFEDLEDYADNLKYKSNQCDSCNTKCNVTCLGCQSCDTGCQKCNTNNCGACNKGCQSHTSKTCCSKCNVGCEGHTSTSTT